MGRSKYNYVCLAEGICKSCDVRFKHIISEWCQVFIVLCNTLTSQADKECVNDKVHESLPIDLSIG
jgi:hypothetical protein